MPSIGTITVDYLHGLPQAVKPQYDIFHRYGTTGINIQKMGARPDQTRLRAVKFGTASECENWSAALRMLIGTTVIVVPEYGVSYSMTITDVSPVDVVPAIIPSTTITIKKTVNVEGYLT